MNTDWIILLASSLALVLGLGLTYWVHSRQHAELVVEPVDEPPDPQENLPAISVIVPARNEARNIQRCVRGLLSQNYPDYEVIVVDDRSTDETPQILAQLAQDELRLRPIHGEELPKGWAGKPHALAQGAEAARGEWLCFVDADTFAGPSLLTSSYRAAQENNADLFTMLTKQELGSFWEKVVLPIVFTGLSFGFPAREVNDPEKPDAIANGQFILIKRQVYQDTGGHSAVRGRIDEDKALAELVKGQGYRLIVADGRALARKRMSTSLPEMWEGWTKNIFLGLRDRLWLLTFGAILGAIGALALPLWLLGGALWLLDIGNWIAAVVTAEAGMVWAYLLATRAQTARAFQISPLYAFTLPLGALVFTAMMLTSTYKVLSGTGVTWKGRRYA